MSTGEARALCIVQDPALRRTLRRTLNATGWNAEFVDSPEQSTGSARLVFIDAESRKTCSVEALSNLLSAGGRIVILGDSLMDDSLVQLLREKPLDHIITDEEVPDESELVVTSSKLRTGDLFGLEKYLSWGAAIHDLPVINTDEKRAAVARVAGYAEGVGARRATVSKIESAVDELLMNALYDAPAAHQKVESLRRVRGTGVTPTGEDTRRALLRYGCDGRYFAVSVLDEYGLLEKQVILNSLLRARTERGRPLQVSESGAGAGLGLYFVLSAVTRFIVNIEPGRRTEVVCLVDLRQQGRDSASCARSLHIFTVPPPPVPDDAKG
jgi:hypothetical protein